MSDASGSNEHDGKESGGDEYECYFVPLSPERKDIDETGFELSGTVSPAGWIVLDCFWDRKGGGVVETPFARVSVRKLDDGQANASLILLVDRDDLNELLPRVMTEVAGFAEERLEARIAECMIYRACPMPRSPRPIGEGRCTLSLFPHSEVASTFNVRFLPEERFQEGDFDDDNYLDIADLDTFGFGDTAAGEAADAGDDESTPQWNLYILEPSYMTEERAGHLVEFLASQVSSQDEVSPEIVVFCAERAALVSPGPASADAGDGDGDRDRDRDGEENGTGG